MQLKIKKMGKTLNDLKTNEQNMYKRNVKMNI